MGVSRAPSGGPRTARTGDRPRSRAWGILGGTFDPIHDGHLALAQTAREELYLDGVVFVPAGLPPHKTDRVITAPSHRAAMVELAIADEPAFVLSSVELERPWPELRSRYRDRTARAAAGAGRLA